LVEYCFAKAKVEGSNPFFRLKNSMKMNNLIYRDKKKRKTYSKYESKRIKLQAIVNNLNLPKEVRYTNLLLLNKLPRNSSKVRIKNRCILTGRGHSVLRICKLSRIKFRELVAQGYLMGIKKSSW
jgi:small subunit ribosomal protein S14